MSGSRRRRSGFFAHWALCRWRNVFVSLNVGDSKGTVLDVFEGCAENASYVRLRSSRLSSGHPVRLPEAKKRLLRALSIVPVAVLSKVRVLLKAARDRRLASGSFRLVPSLMCLRAAQRMPVMCGFALRVSAAVTLSGSRRRRSGFFVH
ncbi:unnamed protein product [Coccothraustes coccothraustes]